MKLRELIDNFERLPVELERWNSADLDELCNEVGLTNTTLSSDNSDEWDSRCISHPVATWLCTDTHVGMRFITLDGFVVAISTQDARKSDVNYEFVSAEARIVLRDFIISLSSQNPDTQFAIADLDEEMGIGYTVGYGENILTDKVIVNGRPATIITHYGLRYELRYEGNPDMWSKVTVQYEDGLTELVDLDHAIIPYKLRPQD